MALSQRDVAALECLQKKLMGKIKDMGKLSCGATDEKTVMVYHRKEEEKVGK